MKSIESFDQFVAEALEFSTNKSEQARATAPQPDPEHMAHLLALAGKALDDTGGNEYKAIELLRRREGMFLRAAQDLVWEVCKQRGLPTPPE